MWAYRIGALVVLLGTIANCQINQDLFHCPEVSPCSPPFKILPETGECFFVSKDQLSWDEARDACKKLDSDLAIPRDTKALAKLLNTIPRDVRVSWFYVGGNDRSAPGKKHSWINGRDVLGPWYDNDPDFRQDDNCIIVSHATGNIADHYNGCVSSASYSHMVGYICQKGCNNLAIGCMTYF